MMHDGERTYESMLLSDSLVDDQLICCLHDLPALLLTCQCCLMVYQFDVMFERICLSLLFSLVFYISFLREYLNASKKRAEKMSFCHYFSKYRCIQQIIARKRWGEWHQGVFVIQ
jgi:hypothetical protein